MTHKDEIVAYVRDCIEGRIPSGQKHIWACQRFLDDLERIGKPDFPYIWDEDKAHNIVRWSAA